VNGICERCARNCFKCDNTGPDFCDVGMCVTGYVRVRPDSCTQCLLGCTNCLSTNIATCLSCSPGTYASSATLCILCPTGCATCSSNSTCTSCQLGFTLSGSTCDRACPFPCATCDASLNCLTCFGGYSVNSSKCVSDVSCTTTTSCSECPLGYALNTNVCVHCSSTGCLRCNPASAS